MGSYLNEILKDSSDCHIIALLLLLPLLVTHLYGELNMPGMVLSIFIISSLISQNSLLPNGDTYTNDGRFFLYITRILFLSLIPSI